MVMLSSKSIKGGREYMEDRYVYYEENNIIICMICDGHGGYLTSSKTTMELPYLLYNAVVNINKSNIYTASEIRNVINDWATKMKPMKDGSTLTGIIVIKDYTFIFNIGDSRTCIKLQPKSVVYTLQPTFDDKGEFINKLIVDYNELTFFCTKDHDSNNFIEQVRIKSAGGKIINNRLNGILSLTRALGDNDIGLGICAVPDIYWVKNDNIDGNILMYSDGIYEPEKNHVETNFSDIYLYTIAEKEGIDALVKYALDNKSEDNITAVLIKIA